MVVEGEEIFGSRLRRERVDKSIATDEISKQTTSHALASKLVVHMLGPCQAEGSIWSCTANIAAPPSHLPSPFYSGERNTELHYASVHIHVRPIK